MLTHEFFGTCRIGFIEHFNRLDSPDMAQSPLLEWRFRSNLDIWVFIPSTFFVAVVVILSKLTVSKKC